MIIKTMQKQAMHKTISFHHPRTDCSAGPRAAVVELADFTELTELMDLAELTEKLLPHRSSPTDILSMMSMVWHMSFGRLGLAAWLSSPPAPAR